MNDKKLTDNEIINALECCCLIDPKTIFLRDDKTGEITTLNMNDIFYLITRQQAEIERLKALAENGASAIDTNNRLVQKFAEIKSEAVKEFAERLNNKGMFPHEINDDYAVGFETIDKLLKETVGENND